MKQHTQNIVEGGRNEEREREKQIKENEMCVCVRVDYRTKLNWKFLPSSVLDVCCRVFKHKQQRMMAYFFFVCSLLVGENEKWEKVKYWKTKTNEECVQKMNNFFLKCA